MRSIGPNAATALYGDVVTLALFVQMDFSPSIFFNSTPNTIDWGGNSWLRTGSLGGVEKVEDSLGETNAVQFSLSGVPNENIALALGTSARGVRCKVYLAILDRNSQAVLDAVLFWNGVLDQMIISEEETSSTISVTSKHFSTLAARVKSLRYTDGDQQRLYPGDTGLRFVTSQSQHKDVWPSAAWGRQ